MTAEANMALASLSPLVFGLFLIQLVEIGVKNDGSIQYHPNKRPVNGDFLTVPLSHRFKVTTLSRLQSVKRTMKLVIF